jgi:hypothetical protein
MADNTKPPSDPQLPNKKSKKAPRSLQERAKSQALTIKIPSRPDSSSDIKVSDKGPVSRAQANAERASIYTKDEKGSSPDTSLDETNALSLRYRIPKKLANLEKKDLKKLSEWLIRQLSDIETERTAFMNRLLRYRALWLDFITTGMSPVFDGAHDVHIPMAFEKIKAMHARIYQAVLGISPPFTIQPRDQIAEIQRFEKEQLLSFLILDYANEGNGWEATVDKDIWNFVADGTSVTKQPWLRDVRKFMDVEEVFKGFKNGKAEYEEKEIEKEEVIYDGPMLANVALEDFYITGKRTDTADAADLVGEKNEWSKSELIKMTRLGFFFEDEVQKIIDSDPLNAAADRNMDRSFLKQQQQDLAGIDKENSGIKRYPIVEAYCRYDIDDDGIDEELVVWIERNSGLILRLTYLERACPGATRPYVIKRYVDRPGSPYGIGMAEMLFGLNSEMDYIHNQRLDYGTIQNLPWGFVRAASGSNTAKPIRLAPGMLYPTDDPQSDVHFPQMRGGTAYGFQEEAMVTRYADNISLPPIALGSQSSQGAARTATGAAAVVSEMNTNTDIHIKRYQRGYKRNLKILDQQVTELLPLGIAVRIVGPEGRATMKRFENRKPLRFQSDYELTANSVNSNKALQRESAQSLLNMLLNPVAIQAGIVNPKNLYNAYKNVLQNSEVHNVEAYISSPEGTDTSPYSAKDELSMIYAGVQPPVYMQDRHAEKLEFYKNFESAEDFGWFSTPEHLEMYGKLKSEHAKYAQAIEAQAAQAAQSGAQNPMLVAQMAAGGGVPQGGPAQQIGDLVPNQGSNPQGVQ